MGVSGRMQLLHSLAERRPRTVTRLSRSAIELLYSDVFRIPLNRS
jgi:hypothetical protein